MKKILIIGIYLAVLGAFGYWGYLKIKPRPSCFDKKQNQDEKGIDCGGVCAQGCAITAPKDLTSDESGFVEGGLANNFDLYALVSNPNQELGASVFEYEFKVKDATGNLLASRSGTGFILPREKKYLIETNIETPSYPTVVEFSLKNPQWVESKEYFERPQLKIINKNYREISGGTGFSEAVGLLKNESPFDFSKIRIKVILKDAQGKVVALNGTEMNTVLSGQNRDFRVFWPNRFPGDVSNMEVQSEVNVFDSEAFTDRFF